MLKYFYFIIVALVFVQCSSTKEVAQTETKEMTSQQDEFRSAPPAAGPATKLNFGETQKFTLDNGLNVIVVENRKLPRVSFQLTIDTWTFVEGDKAGAADLTGQLLSAGTMTRSKAEIDEAVDFIGANLSTGARSAFGSSLSKHKETLLDLMSDVLLNPSFPEDQLDKFKKQTISNLAFSKDDPNLISNNVGNVLNYGTDHPFGELTTEATVSNVTVGDCKAYYQKYFKPNISYLVIVGDINASEAKSLAQKFFGSWKKGDVERVKFEKPAGPEAASIDFVHKEGAVQSVINVTYPVEFDRKSEDYTAARLMNSFFGGFFNSRLNMNLREGKAYTYGARSSLNPNRWIGEFSTSMSVRNEVTDSSLNEILYEINRLRDETITQDELEFVKSFNSGNFAMALEQPQTLAGYALNIERLGLDEDFYESYLQKLEAVTVEDIQKMAQKYLRPENAHIVIVGNKDEVAEKLEPFAKDGKINFYDTYGNPIEEVEGALPEDLTASQVIADYINAIGGADKIKEVSDYASSMKATTPMGDLVINQHYMSPDKAKMTVEMGGNVMQSVVINGDQGKAGGMAGSKMLEGEDLEKAMADSNPFPELIYEKMGYAMEIKGLEAIGDKKCVKVEVIKAEDNKIIEFYDLMTSLKVRSVTTISAQGQSMTTTTDFEEYKDVNGIMLPHKVSQSGGAMPFPMNFELQEAKINQGLSASDFEIK